MFEIIHPARVKVTLEWFTDMTCGGERTRRFVLLVTTALKAKRKQA